MFYYLGLFYVAVRVEDFQRVVFGEVSLLTDIDCLVCFSDILRIMNNICLDKIGLVLQCLSHIGDFNCPLRLLFLPGRFPPKIHSMRLRRNAIPDGPISLAKGHSILRRPKRLRLLHLIPPGKIIVSTIQWHRPAQLHDVIIDLTELLELETGFDF